MFRIKDFPNSITPHLVAFLLAALLQMSIFFGWWYVNLICPGIQNQLRKIYPFTSQIPKLTIFLSSDWSIRANLLQANFI